jgi:uncharacterized protein YndB with AHSA1/START domain
MNATIDTSTERPFVISHMFNAPRERVWNAWTKCEELTQWFGPAGTTIAEAKMNFRPGGVFHHCMHTLDGKEMWGKFVYRQIVAPEKIVLVNSFSDRDGGITRHPWNARWPLEMLSTVTFSAEGNKTKLTIEWIPLNPTDEERATFDSAHDGMQQGWSGTFGQLTGYLVKGRHGK